MSKIKRYTKTDLKYLHDNYKTKGNKEIGLKINRSADSVKNKMRSLGLKRTEDEVLKLLKQPNSGNFKKGQKPHNTNYNGHERVNKDGFVMIRVSKGNYVVKSRMIWEEKNGELKENEIIRFKDGNKQNCNIENLYKSTKNDLISENANREKQALSIKRTWDRYFYLNQMGIKRGWYKKAI
tara:strand:+ start:9533 stop:10075 length:543 start_codon:yes stop_codon:yes gene_type:complete